MCPLSSMDLHISRGYFNVDIGCILCSITHVMLVKGHEIYKAKKACIKLVKWYSI